MNKQEGLVKALPKCPKTQNKGIERKKKNWSEFTAIFTIVFFGPLELNWFCFFSSPEFEEPPAPLLWKIHIHSKPEQPELHEGASPSKQMRTHHTSAAAEIKILKTFN